MTFIDVEMFKWLESQLPTASATEQGLTPIDCGMTPLLIFA